MKTKMHDAASVSTLVHREVLKGKNVGTCLGRTHVERGRTVARVERSTLFP